MVELSGATLFNIKALEKLQIISINPICQPWSYFYVYKLCNILILCNYSFSDGVQRYSHMSQSQLSIVN